MDEKALARAITRISHEILERNKGIQNVVLVGIKRRGAVLAGRIAAKILEVEGSAPPVYEVDITMFRDDRERSHGDDAMSSGLNMDVEGKRVIIVDDVLYTGRTARAAVEAVFSKGRAENIQLAVMVDRGHRELPMRPDYVGKNLPTSRGERVLVLVREYDGAEGVAIVKAEKG